MPETIRYLYQGGQGEIVEKKSRFIATLKPVYTEEEAQAFIDAVKKRYWDARHNCSAFILGEQGQLMRCSDDGEPPHTAGRPMLEILKNENLTNVCVVVTRYFGGILLGTGGLVRAYQAATQEGIRQCQVVTRLEGVPTTVYTDYNGVGKLLYLTGSQSIPVLETEYTDQVVSRLLIPPDRFDAFTKAMQEATGGTARFEAEDPVYYVLQGDQVVFLRT